MTEERLFKVIPQLTHIVNEVINENEILHHRSIVIFYSLVADVSVGSITNAP